MRPTWIVIAALLSGCGGLREAQEAKYQGHRVNQATADYEAAAADPLGRCVAAGAAARAYEDAGARSDAQAWRARETLDCQAAHAAMSGAEPLTE